MKRIFFLLVICLGSVGAFAQDGFFVKNNHIKKWYREGENLEAEIKKAILLPEFQELVKKYEVKTESLQSYFHFIDFNNNGELDLLFDGNMNIKNMVFIFLKKGNSYLMVLQQEGTIIQANLPDEDNNLSLSILNNACCGYFVNSFSQWVCITENNTSYFQNVAKSLIFKNTLLPSVRINAPVKFTVVKSANLRVDPEVNNQRRISGMSGWEGNSVASYPINSTGTIFAEIKDNRNKFWYFVRMNNDAGLEVNSDRFKHVKEVENVASYSYYGWICSDDISLE